MKKQFDLNAVVAELEKISAMVEDPQTSLDQIEVLMEKAKELTDSVKEYLRKYDVEK